MTKTTRKTGGHKKNNNETFLVDSKTSALKVKTNLRGGVFNKVSISWG